MRGNIIMANVIDRVVSAFSTSVSAPKDLINESINASVSAAESNRKLDVEYRLDFLNDDFKDRIEYELKKQFCKETYEGIKLLIDDSINIVEYVSNEIGSIYDDSPIRYLSDSAGSIVKDNRYDEILTLSMLDIKLAREEKICFACNECVVAIQPRNGTIEYDLLPPNTVSVIQDSADPSKPCAIIYEINLTNTEKNTSVLDKDRLRYFVYWDIQGNHFMFDNHHRRFSNDDNPNRENRYKDKNGNFILPFVIFHKNYNENTVWDNTSTNKLFSAQIQIGVLGTLHNYYLKWNSFKQLAVYGDFDIKVPQDQIRDPGYMFKILGESANVSVLDTQGQMDVFDMMIMKKIERALNQEGLSLESFSKTGSPESGYKLKIKNEPKLRRINMRKKFARVYENELFEKTRIVNNTVYPNNKINEDLEFHIDFSDYKPEQDPIELDKHRAYLVSTNMATPVDFIREDNPDIETDEDALKLYNENKATNKQLTIDTTQAENNIDNELNVSNEGI